MNFTAATFAPSGASDTSRAHGSRLSTRTELIGARIHESSQAGASMVVSTPEVTTVTLLSEIETPQKSVLRNFRGMQDEANSD